MAHLIHSVSLEKFKLVYTNWNPSSVPSSYTEGYHAIAITDDGWIVSHGKVMPLGTGLTAGTYGSSTSIPVITVGADGKLSISATNIPDASTEAKGLVQLLTGYTTDSSTLAATASAVKAAYDDLNTKINGLLSAKDALLYKGIVTGADISEGNSYGTLFPTAVTDDNLIEKGSVYKVATAGYVNGIKVEVGDMLICNTDTPTVATSENYSSVASEWDIILNNIDVESYLLKNGSTTSLDFLNSTFKNVLKSGTLTADKETYLPSSGGYLISTPNLSGVGGAYNPVYIAANGTVTACSFTIPTDAKFTDTTYKFASVSAPKSDGSGSQSFTIGAETSGSVTDITFGGNIYYDLTNNYITAANTWRPFNGYVVLNDNTLTNLSLGSHNILFGLSLLVKSVTTTSEGISTTIDTIDVAWAEVDENGNITYI